MNISEVEIKMHVRDECQKPYLSILGKEKLLHIY